MPLYEYKCISCEKIHEVMQKFSDPRLENCPDCNGTVEKLLSLSSFSLKGTGWYTTDYKAKPQAPSSEKRSSSSESAAPKAENKGESSSSSPSEAKASPTPAASAAPAPASSS